MDIKAFIMDMDGTLTDSMLAWRTLCDRYLISKGREPEPHLIEKLKPMSLKQSADYFREEYGIEDDWKKIIDDEMAIMDHFYHNEVELKPGVPEFLGLANKAGIRMCIASATEKPQVEAALSRCGILDRFEFIITCSESTGKDEPGIYEDALSRLGTEKKATWVVEDASYAVRTAHDAGFKVAGVYDASAKRDRQKISKCCEVYGDTMFEVAEKLGL